MFSLRGNVKSVVGPLTVSNTVTDKEVVTIYHKDNVNVIDSFDVTIPWIILIVCAIQVMPLILLWMFLP